MNTDNLSTRQREVFSLLICGKTNAEIALAFGISEKTVKAHVTIILNATRCKSRAQVIAKHYQEQQAT